MPEIDNDLFELLSLIGLGLIALVGLVAISSIGKLRKSLDRAITEWNREAAWRGGAETEPSLAQSAPAAGAGLAAADAEMPDAADAEEDVEATPDAEPGVSEGPGVIPVATERSDDELEAELAGEAEPEPVTAAEPEPQPVAAEPEPVIGEAGPAFDPEPVGAAEPEPVTAAEPEPQPVAAEPEPVAEAQPVATAEAEPEGQPFERDGRWWFRRGDELLVYDEMSGQWQPAGQTTSASPVATQEFPEAGEESALGAQSPVDAAQPGAFWKCPSCGAVNGSTATSCRMCFAAKP